MINFNLKKDKNSNLYCLTFMKMVHKRSGEYVEEPGETLYVVSSKIPYLITFAEVSNKFGEQDVSLKEYLSEFHKAYKEVCELLKKTLS